MDNLQSKSLQYIIRTQKEVLNRSPASHYPPRTTPFPIHSQFDNLNVIVKFHLETEGEIKRQFADLFATIAKIYIGGPVLAGLTTGFLENDIYFGISIGATTFVVLIALTILGILVMALKD